MKIWPFLFGLICGSVILFSINHHVIKKQNENIQLEQELSALKAEVDNKMDITIDNCEDIEELRRSLKYSFRGVGDIMVVLASKHPFMYKDFIKVYSEINDKLEMYEPGQEIPKL